MAWYLFFLISLSYAQSISTTIPVPPLQWINLTPLLSGPSPPPLKDASIGYDDTSRSLIIFGGEADGSIAVAHTYLLNMNSLTWSTPSPPANLPSSPSARSAALGGNDFAASNRHGFVVIGGKGSDGNTLNDVWEYDYNNQFWSQVVLSPGGPSGRWGASGGIDPRVSPVQDAVLPGPNNTIYLAGGFDGRSPISLSDIWRLNLSGTLSSNMPNTVSGSWDHISVNGLPAKVDQAGTMVLKQIIAVGGCNTSSVSGDSCAQQDSYVIDTDTRAFIPPNGCPAPRFGASLVQNLNDFSTSFSSQVFLLLGTFNTSLWQDDGGLQKGEVAVLDVDTGTWGRVLPSGDPGTSGPPTFPSPREGAATFPFTSALVGQSLSRSAASDIVVFGGRDASGKYLSDIWLLRAYKGSLTKSNQTWSGFGNGQLQTGANASGTGVTVQYLSRCASAIASQSSGSPTSSIPSTSSTSASTSMPGVLPIYNTSLTHKLLAPLSVALLLPAVVLFRLSAPWFYTDHKTERHIALVYMSALMALIAYGIGIAGISTSFTTIKSTAYSAKRSSSALLQTAHGKAGIALFVGLYGLVPVLIVVSACLRLSRKCESEKNIGSRGRANSTETTEKLASQGVRIGSANHSPSPPSSPRTRVHSFGTSGMGRASHDERVSSDSESISSAGAQRTFEVVNRPRRIRNVSGSWLAVPTGEPLGYQRGPVNGRSLRDVDWLDRRRSLNAVGELDYHLSQANRVQESPTPATTDGLVTTPMVGLVIQHPIMPSLFDRILRGLFHAFLLGLCILTLSALWLRASKAIFVVFLLPQKSILTSLISRLRASAPELPSSSFSAPMSAGVDQFPFPTDSRSPYVHQPPYRTAILGTQDDNSPGAPRSVETGEYDEDEDEDTRQRRIEDEMGRRDVNIVTVPKRRLLIANPS